MDHAASTPVRPEVLEAMRPFLTEECGGNPSSIHAAGRAARKALEDAREKVARLLDADSPREIVFTSGGTESDNLAVIGAMRANASRGRRVLRSPIEHPAVIRACDFLAESRLHVDVVPVNAQGVVEPDAFRSALQDGTALATVMFANNEIGTVQPIVLLAAAAKEKRVLFHTDAVQAAGKITVKVRELGVDLLSISAHKIHGPKGAGALYVRKGVRVAPLLHGGEHEFGRRAGTENVAGAAGLAKALELAFSEMDAEGKRLTALRSRLETGLRARIPGAVIHGEGAPRRLPGVTSASFEGIDGEGVVLHLDQAGIAVASGSACTSSHREPSHVLSAMGVPPELAGSSTRYSLGRSNTEQDVDAAIEATARAVEKLRGAKGAPGKAAPRR